MLIKWMQNKQTNKQKIGNVTFSCESKEDAYSQKNKNNLSQQEALGINQLLRLVAALCVILCDINRRSEYEVLLSGRNLTKP